MRPFDFLLSANGCLFVLSLVPSLQADSLTIEGNLEIQAVGTAAGNIMANGTIESTIGFKLPDGTVINSKDDLKNASAIVDTNGNSVIHVDATGNIQLTSNLYLSDATSLTQLLIDYADRLSTLENTLSTLEDTLSTLEDLINNPFNLNSINVDEIKQQLVNETTAGYPGYNSGNVAIGTDKTNAVLEVAGVTEITGDLAVRGTLIQSVLGDLSIGDYTTGE